MKSHVQHHFVPRFLLQQWAGPDGKLNVFRWHEDQLLRSRRSPRSVGKLPHLYSTMRSSAVPDVRMEREYFGPKMDDIAAPIHRQILATGLRSLSREQELNWSRFLLAQMVRTPSAVEFARMLARRFPREGLQAQPAVPGVPLPLGPLIQSQCHDDADEAGLKALLRIIEAPPSEPVHHRRRLDGHTTSEYRDRCTVERQPPSVLGRPR